MIPILDQQRDSGLLVAGPTVETLTQMLSESELVMLQGIPGVLAEHSMCGAVYELASTRSDRMRQRRSTAMRLMQWNESVISGTYAPTRPVVTNAAMMEAA